MTIDTPIVVALMAAGTSLLSITATIVNSIWTRAVDRKTDRITTIEDRLQVMTTKLIEEKFRAETKVIDARMHAVEHSSRDNQTRITTMETGVLERDHAVEKSMLKKLEELREIVATKDDLDRLREEIRR